jgi:hypothetical protein
MEEWKNGRMERWKDGKMERWKDESNPISQKNKNAADYSRS